MILLPNHLPCKFAWSTWPICLTSVWPLFDLTNNSWCSGRLKRRRRSNSFGGIPYRRENSFCREFSRQHSFREVWPHVTSIQIGQSYDLNGGTVVTQPNFKLLFFFKNHEFLHIMHAIFIFLSLLARILKSVFLIFDFRRRTRRSRGSTQRTSQRNRTLNRDFTPDEMAILLNQAV